MKNNPSIYLKSFWHKCLGWVLFCISSGILSSCQNPKSASVALSPRERQEKLIRYLQSQPTVKSTETWDLPEPIKAQPQVGLIIRTYHYEIYTSLQDPLILQGLAVFLETAFRSYGQVFGQEIEVKNRLAVYFFDNRQQWEEFTHHWTGAAAGTYLQIRAGAYYLDKACVAYHLGRKSNFAVLAHEGWHQFSDAVFAYRLPAWVDEGLATNFESYQWEDGKVRFDPRRNGARLMDLQKALASGNRMSLAELLTMDAGRILSHDGMNSDGETHAVPQITRYYAQLYALVRFLREDDYGRRLLAFRKMLNNGRLGKWPLSAELQAEAMQRTRNPSRQWNAITGSLIFQSYIASDPTALEKQYLSFCQKILHNLRFDKKL